MGTGSTALLIVAAFLTAMLSGIFGMAGGLVLMGVLALMLPVSAVFVTHGVLQFTANGWRAVLHRDHVQWPILLWYALSAVSAAALVVAVAYVPSKPVLFFLLWAVTLLIWLPKSWLELDAARPGHAVTAGFLVTGLNLTAGVAGPLLDLFFVRTALTRHQIVATKAATQVLSHAARIAVYGIPFFVEGMAGMPPLWVFALAIPLSMIGTMLGGRVLDQMSDVNFKRYTAWIVTAVGLIYLAKAVQLWTV